MNGFARRLSVLVALLGLMPGWARAGEAEKEGATGDERPAVDYVLDKGEVHVVVGDKRERIELPAPAVALHVAGGSLYVALGEHGAAVLDLAEPDRPRLARRVPVPHGRVVEFFEAGGKLWMRIESTTAVPLETGAVPVQAATGDTVPVRAAPSTGAGVGPDREVAGEPGEQPAFSAPIHITDLFPGKVKLDAGSIGLSASAGGAGMWGTQQIEESDGFWDEEEVSIAGPMVSIGVKYRWGI